MRKSVWFFIALVSAAIIYSGVWYATASFVRLHAMAWLQGLTITHGPPTLAGFPLKAEVRFPQVALSLPDARWQADEVRVFARPFVFDRLSVDLAGTHIFNDMTLQAEGALVTLTAPAHIDIAITQATLPDILPQPLARTLQNLTLSVDVTGTIPSGAALPEALEAWRVDGGTLEVRELAADWPPISASGSGTIALDKNLQPEGAFTTTFRGFLEVIDMLVAAGRMDNAEASLARGALVLLATTPHEGAAPELKVNVTVQDRKVYAGPVTLMDMPRVAWPSTVTIP
jgi:hypothetical protein